MSKFFIILSFFSCILSVDVRAQIAIPTINPTITVDGDEGIEDGTDFQGSAPIEAKFKANPEDYSDYIPYFEWRFYKEGGSPEEPYLIRRNEEDTEVTFTEAGTHCAVVYAYFVNGTDTVAYDYNSYWAEASPIRIMVKESKLDFPNAFSPNGDGINDIYCAKEGYQSIISFKAAIYNRWGQKLYEWDDPAGGWDGKFNGTDVKQGVYYVHVEARGADGVKYSIKRDVNLLRGYTEKGSSSHD